ncbi:uncharacterized protein CIMG_07954 [Coccidioides immitis RS]|uniref:Uncharacterized protein n=4 Tax=Coccidioides immitis TaxID=5501 RepID=J3K4H4_COCIM|nr:uncharacterized protein CIMG_07954 [Coccidioides immitis RS]KMP06334.1 hypothetical protein CIRG_06015 [Coccidioides immitis RMSCC 2394]KMU80463.1 hypothetical protein CISG_02314 [Coccidioides immitis RMSCC 3703]KMU83902.1 hypothetical protein CIHG_01686 [Coccidioides immitis H538.4]TPX22685.1 hypothetical protein DIZ76_014564 [Coccidioides immitis]EAS29208.3 hypothetical protein CIMG_07954 [Coccidioides immitis RS]
MGSWNAIEEYYRKAIDVQGSARFTDRQCSMILNVSKSRRAAMREARLVRVSIAMFDTHRRMATFVVTNSQTRKQRGDLIYSSSNLSVVSGGYLTPRVALVREP